MIRNRFRRYIWCVLLAGMIMALVIVACGSAKSAIVGKWIELETALTEDTWKVLEFHEDGTVTVSQMTMGQGNRDTTCDYRFLDDTRVRVECPNYWGWVYTFDADAMTLTESNGVVLRKER